MKAVQIATSKERPWPPEAIERAVRVKGDETLAITVKKDTFSEEIASYLESKSQTAEHSPLVLVVALWRKI